jgi:MFS transporter, SHS family, lactate transporter
LSSLADSTPKNFSPSPATSPATEGHGPAVFAGFLGWTLDAFDFFLVVLSLTAIAQEFHRSDKEIAFSITLTLAFRPVGAFIFGLMADRYGRRIPLMIDLVFYSVVEVATGFAHSFTTFLVLRALFGVGMGGEWGVGASLAMEKVPPRLRGFLSGVLQQGYALGYLLAAGCYFFVFPRWGWRPMFFIGGLPALLGLFVRFKVKESEVWKKTRHPNWSDLGRAILSHWKLFLYLTVLMMMMNFASHGTQDMFPTFLQRQWGMKPTQRAVITAISMVGAICGGTLLGFLSDRFGRRRSMIAARLSVRLRWFRCGPMRRRWLCWCSVRSCSNSWCRERGASFPRTFRNYRPTRCADSSPVSPTSVACSWPARCQAALDQKEIQGQQDQQEAVHASTTGAVNTGTSHPDNRLPMGMPPRKAKL